MDDKTEHAVPTNTQINPLTFEIRAFMCSGCGSCSRICPDGAVSGLVHNPFKIDQSKCSGCGKCLDVCMFDAIKAH